MYFMENWNEAKDTGFVDAIEEGKIVRVHKDYALKEGLLILRKSLATSGLSSVEEKKKKEVEVHSSKVPRMEEFRKELSWKKSSVVQDLVDNFHWEISKRRRERGISRTQLAKLTGVHEREIRMLETGIVPHEDFVLINKIQEILVVNLRKDKQDYVGSMRALVDESNSESVEKKKEKKSEDKGELFGEGIELVE